MNLVVNSIIAWLDEDMRIHSMQRVLWIAPDQTSLVVIDIGDLNQLPEFKEYTEVAEALRNGMARKLELDPYAKFMNATEAFIEKHKELRDEAWSIIGEIVEIEPGIYDKKLRGRLIQEVCEKTGQHKRAVYRHLKKYWVRGKIINALLPEFDNCGARGKEKQPNPEIKRGRPPKAAREDPSLLGVNVTEHDKKRIRLAIKQWYLNTDQNPLTFVYQKMLEEYYSVGVYFQHGVPIPILPDAREVISYIQFRYWALQELANKKETLQKRIGIRKYQLLKRPLLGNATLRAAGPGAVFEIDATIANVYLVSMFDRTRIIGRPVVYIVKDVFSRLVAGMYVGLEGPSWIGAMMALENATMDKVEFCSAYGITINQSDWPSRYLPKSVTADRGEMESHNADNLVASLGVRIDNAPPYRADLKGIIEQHFEIVDRKIGPFVPGLVRQQLRERGELDYRLGARMTIEAFTKIIILSILEHNKKQLNDYPIDIEMSNDQVPPVPLDLWNWGVINRSGYLHEKPTDIVRLNLMPRREASVTRQGIQFEKMYYSCSDALLEDWYVRAANGRFRVPISYDPRNCHHIYIPKEDGTGFIKCQLLDHFNRFKDKRLEEAQDQLFFEEVESKRRETTQRQNAATANAQIEAIIAEETKLTESEINPGESKSSRVKDIKKNRQMEKELIRQQEAWELDALPTKTQDNNNSSVVSLDNVRNKKHTQHSDVSETDSILMMLQRQRDARRGKP